MWLSSQSGPLSRLEASTRKPGVSLKLVNAAHLPRVGANPERHSVGAPVHIILNAKEGIKWLEEKRT